MSESEAAIHHFDGLRRAPPIYTTIRLKVGRTAPHRYRHIAGWVPEHRPTAYDIGL